MHNISLTILCCALRQLCGVIFAFRLHATRQLEIICLIIYAFKYFFDSIYTQSRSSFSLVSLIFVSSNTVKLEILKSCLNIDFSCYIMQWRINRFSTILGYSLRYDTIAYGRKMNFIDTNSTFYIRSCCCFVTDVFCLL